MTRQEIEEIGKRIDAMIGSYEDNRKEVENAALSDRIRKNERYRKLREKLFKIAESSGEKALALTFFEIGSIKRGLTPKGKVFQWYGNNGLEERSRYCGTLVIDGKTVFTSGTVAKALEYIISN